MPSERPAILDDVRWHHSALALLFGYLIYSEHQSVDESRDEVAPLRDLIASFRETVRKTPEIEREVIVLREISTASARSSLTRRT